MMEVGETAGTMTHSAANGVNDAAHAGIVQLLDNRLMPLVSENESDADWSDGESEHYEADEPYNQSLSYLS